MISLCFVRYERYRNHVFFFFLQPVPRKNGHTAATPHIYFLCILVLVIVITVYNYYFDCCIYHNYGTWHTSLLVIQHYFKFCKLYRRPIIWQNYECVYKKSLYFYKFIDYEYVNNAEAAHLANIILSYICHFIHLC